MRLTNVIIGLTTAAVAGGTIGLLIARDSAKGKKKNLKDNLLEVLEDVTLMVSNGKRIVTKMKDLALTSEEREAIQGL